MRSEGFWLKVSIFRKYLWFCFKIEGLQGCVNWQKFLRMNWFKGKPA